MKPSIGQQRRAAALGHFLLERFRLALKEHGGLRLADRDVDRDELGVVHALEQQQIAAVVDDRDGDEPVVLARFGFRRGGHALGGVERQHALGGQLLRCADRGSSRSAASTPRRGGRVCASCARMVIPSPRDGNPAKGAMGRARRREDRDREGDSGDAARRVVARSSRSRRAMRRERGDAAAPLGIATAHGSYEALIDDPDVDAIYNPLPNHLHVPWTIRALEAGKHVLCEKPIGLTVAEAQRLIDVRDRTGRKVQEAFMVRTHPQWIAARRSGARAAASATCAAWPGTSATSTATPANIRNVAEYGGGAPDGHRLLPDPHVAHDLRARAARASCRSSIAIRDAASIACRRSSSTSRAARRSARAAPRSSPYQRVQHRRHQVARWRDHSLRSIRNRQPMPSTSPDWAHPCSTISLASLD